jgi:hypothetical protein
MIIKDATVQPIIGIEVTAINGAVSHVLTLVIQAKNINPDDFIGMRGTYDIKIEGYSGGKKCHALKDRIKKLTHRYLRGILIATQRG